MGWTRREFLAMASAGAVMGLGACTGATTTGGGGDAGGSSDSGNASTASEPAASEFESLRIDDSKWLYDEANDIYYQLGLTYCLKPATESYESLAVFVPGGFLTGEKKDDGTYTCTVNAKGIVGNFTPSTAPILMPINTGTVSPQSSPTSYTGTGLAPFIQAGCIYVYPGFRGRSSGYDTSSKSDDLYPGGAPWPVVDLKAAIRYLRYNSESLPCDTSRVFVFGFSAGGGLGAVLGASGGSALFTPYLESIGAVTVAADGGAVSDAICGAATWCPITSFDTADAAYEWAAGQYSTSGSRSEGAWGHQLSQDLATAYGEYVNQMDLRDGNDAQYTLDESEGSAYGLGSYATALLDLLNESAANFVQDTAFPYTYTPQHLDDPSFPGDPNLAASRASSQVITTQPLVQPQGQADQQAPDDGSGTTDDGSTTAGAADATTTGDATADAAATESSTDTGADATATADASADATATTVSTPITGTAQVQSTIYATVQDYFSALNEDHWWINYNLRRQTVAISSLRDFSLHLRPAEASVSPYDTPKRGSKINQLFGVGEESTLHFDSYVSELVDKNVDTYASLTGWDETFEDAWSGDMAKKDDQGNAVPARVLMMSPLYYLSGHYAGYGQATVAPYWRINEGAFDTSAPICMSANLAMALRHYDGVSSVTYTSVWGQGHVLAERSGRASQNLLSWVVSCLTA